jgi:hypothetical protein
LPEKPYSPKDPSGTDEVFILNFLKQILLEPHTGNLDEDNSLVEFQKAVSNLSSEARENLFITMQEQIPNLSTDFFLKILNPDTNLENIRWQYDRIIDDPDSNTAKKRKIEKRKNVKVTYYGYDLLPGAMIVNAVFDTLLSKSGGKEIEDGRITYTTRDINIKGIQNSKNRSFGTQKVTFSLSEKDARSLIKPLEIKVLGNKTITISPIVQLPGLRYCYAKGIVNVNREIDKPITQLDIEGLIHFYKVGNNYPEIHLFRHTDNDKNPHQVYMTMRYNGRAAENTKHVLSTIKKSTQRQTASIGSAGPSQSLYPHEFRFFPTTNTSPSSSTPYVPGTLLEQLDLDLAAQDSDLFGQDDDEDEEDVDDEDAEPAAVTGQPPRRTGLSLLLTTGRGNRFSRPKKSLAVGLYSHKLRVETSS